MFEIVNFTGKKIGITDEFGKPMKVLPSVGNARCETKLIVKDTVDATTIYERTYGRVMGLPRSDSRYKKMFIVHKEVAEAVGNTRFDLLVPEDPMVYEGTTFYRHLVNV